ncbi:hypothetical protein PQZ67_gp80 [Escherichia phage ZCEC13]|nr:hypothetical protein PQZ67_gp80 [Escherichia phage ZCEC13]
MQLVLTSSSMGSIVSSSTTER